MKLSTSLTSIVLALLIVFLPGETSAQGLANVCDGPDCSACNFVDLANRLIDWLIGLVTVLFAVLMVMAGFGLVTAGGNPSALQSAKDRFVNALIGFMIVLAAWLLVDTLMRGLLGGTGEISGFGPWSKVECWEQAEMSGLPSVDIDTFWPGDPDSAFATAAIVSTTLCEPTPGGNLDCEATRNSCPAGTVPLLDDSDSTNHYINCTSATGGASTPFTATAAGTCGSGTCVPITIPCKSSTSCTISPDMVSRLDAMHSAAGVAGARVSEGYPPTRTHKSSCHTNGTCIDYSKAGGMSSADVLAVYNSATANGLRPVYEVGNESRRQELINAGVPAASVKNYGSWISGEHFSIYGY